MPRYAPLPVNDDNDAELNRAFENSDDDDDGDHDHDHTPLLPRPIVTQRSPPPAPTPRTAFQPRTIDGRYNFEYDFPPPGSPPREFAGPNHWGNTNGVVVSGPINYDPESSNGWLSRAWTTLTGARNRGREIPAHPIGSGISNDGVFSNLSSRPTVARPTDSTSTNAQAGTAEPDSIFHAPEVAPEDAPPSYWVSQADAAPAYTVVATTPDEFMIDALPAGNIYGFLWAFVVSVFLEWIGFALAFMLSVTHAGRCGARAGLGVSFIRLGIWFKNRTEDPNGSGPEDIWWGALDAVNSTTPRPFTGQFNYTMLNSTNYNYTVLDAVAIPRHAHRPMNSTWHEHHSLSKSALPITQWIAFFLMIIGWFIFMSSLFQFWRVKRWERSIQATNQPQVSTQNPRLLASLQNALGAGSVIHSTTRDHVLQHDAAVRDGQRNGSQDSRRDSSENGTGLDEATRQENRLRRDLVRLGYL